MAITLVFPNQADLIREEAEAYQRLPSEEKWRILFEVIEEGFRAIQNSPNRDAIIAQYNVRKEQWVKAQRELFAKFGLLPRGKNCASPVGGFSVIDRIW